MISVRMTKLVIIAAIIATAAGLSMMSNLVTEVSAQNVNMTGNMTDTGGNMTDNSTSDSGNISGFAFGGA